MNEVSSATTPALALLPSCRAQTNCRETRTMQREKGHESDEEKDYDSLPVEDFKAEIIASIRANQVVVVIGETGSGKTTKIPQYCADMGPLQIREDSGEIGKRPELLKVAVTQPRRVAAITVAHRVASERRCQVGGEVGYTIRFDDQSDPERTKLKFMTDGILVKECLADSQLMKYDVVVLDEAHERSVHTDILFALMKSVCSRRKNLRVVVTSATLNAEKFSAFFNECPIIKVPGRVYPVDIYHSKHRQVVTLKGPATKDYISSAADLALKIHREQGEGHILVFLTGQEDIEDACRALRNRALSSNDTVNQDGLELLVLPLYSSLPTDAQKQVFKLHDSRTRKCVIATNIAETSITVPNVRFVIDTGYVKQKAYDPTRRMEALVTVPISQVAAQQRAGRAGRTAPGLCYRLYSSDCYENFASETIPEIMRSNLSNVVLYLKVLGIHNILEFDFLDKPFEDQLEDALQQLHTLGALDDEGKVTVIGRKMSTFAVEPSLGRMLVEAFEVPKADSYANVATVCAMLSVEDIWWVDHSKRDDDETNERRRHIEATHSRFWDSMGDFVTYFNVFSTWFHEGKEAKSWCEENFIKFRAMRTAKKIRDQLVADGLKLKSDISTELPKELSYKGKARICYCVASGLYMNAARRIGGENMYRSLPLKGSDVQMLNIHPTSALRDNTSEAEYIVYQELLASGKIYVKHLSVIHIDTLERRRANYRMISANRLCGIADPTVEPKTIVPDEREANAALPIKSVSDSNEIDKKSARNMRTSRAEGELSSAELAKQRYLARKRKAGGMS